MAKVSLSAEITQRDIVTHRQVEEFVQNARNRIPGLKTLKINVADDGEVTFDYEVIRIVGGKGKI